MSAKTNADGRAVGAARLWWRAISVISLSLAFGGAATGQSERSPWEGRDVFREKGCIHCHAVNGEGGEIGPDLGQRNFYGTYLELGARMWNHFPAMAARMREFNEPLPRFTRTEMSQLIAYLSFLRYMGVGGRERQGRRLLKDKGCMACHSFGGVGGSVGPDLSAMEEYLSPLRLAESMWNHGPKVVSEMERLGVRRPQFYGREFIDLATGVRSFMSPKKVPADSFDLGNPLLGAGLVQEKHCLQCHGVQAGGSAPSFEAMDLDFSVTELAGRMWNHGPAMWKRMTELKIEFPIFARGEMANVLAFLYGLKLKDSPGDATVGRELLEQKGCIRCHSEQGRAETGAPDLAALGHVDSPEGMIAKMWNHAPGMRQRIEERSLRWPRLEGRDMANLYAYMESQVVP